MIYFKIVILFIYYSTLLVLCSKLSRKVLLTPEFCFIIGFLPHIFYSLFYVQRWDLDLSVETMIIYVLGATVFVVSSLIFRKGLGTHLKIYDGVSKNILCIDRFFLLLFVVFQLISLYVTAQTVRGLTGRSDIFEAIDMFGFLSKSTGLKMPWIPGKMNMICYTSSFIWIYYFLHGIVYKYKTHYILVLFNLFLSIIHHVMTGSRGGVVELIIAGGVYWYFFRGEKKQWRNVLPIKYIVGAIVGGIILLFLFRLSLVALGRAGAVGENTSDYIARYLSASMKNIDIKVRSGSMGFRNIEKWASIKGVLSFVSKVFGIEYTKTVADASTYLSVNGFGLGNVYTIYYSFVQDLSYLGLFVFIPIMSFISEFVFSMSLKYNQIISKRNTISLGMVLYGYVISKLFFSFFSNRFFDSIVSTGTVWCLLFWWMVKCFVEKRIIIGKTVFRIK